MTFIERLNSSIQLLSEFLVTDQTGEGFDTILHEFVTIIHEENIANLNPEWLQNVSISSFTHVEYVIMAKLQHTISFNEIFSKEFLSLLLLINSTVYFLIATENWFICKKQVNQKFSSSKIRSIFPKNLKAKIKKMKRHIYCQKIHSKAIHILNSFFEKSNPLSRHLAVSYQNNYEPDQFLDHIGNIFLLYSPLII